jgi:asparagine synthetase A
VLLPTQSSRDQCTGLNGDLSFFTPSCQRSHEATHIQLKLTEDALNSRLDSLFVMVQYVTPKRYG